MTAVEDVTFPIDVVYTWVDGQDPELRAKRQKYRGDGDAGIAAREVGESRYTSHDELKYSLRSLQTYAGFVRHVYIVTDGQTPEWLDPDAPGVTVVDHKDIFPEGVLPVFNSHAIETRLHHIPGLSDHYLYFNDDVFVGRSVTPQHFFHANGVARLPFSTYQIGVGAPHPQASAPNSAGRNVRRLLEETYGVSITHKFLHTPHPQRRDVLNDMERDYPEAIERTMRSRFRSVEDVAPHLLPPPPGAAHRPRRPGEVQVPLRRRRQAPPGGARRVPEGAPRLRLLLPQRRGHGPRAPRLRALLRPRLPGVVLPVPELLRARLTAPHPDPSAGLCASPRAAARRRVR